MLKVIWRLLITHSYWRLRLQHVGYRAILFKPMMITGASRIRIGPRSIIREFARLEVVVRKDVSWKSKLRIGERVNIEQGVHLACQGELTIEDDVTIGPYCTIVDCYHPHDPPDLPPKIGDRLPQQPTFLTIGKGTIVGAHSVILPNVRIGRGCTVGAGAVITRDVPDYSVVAAPPARVISAFNPEARTWT